MSQLASMSSVKLLSGRELVENGSKSTRCPLPPKSSKQIIATGTWLEKKQVESGLEIKRSLIADQRVEKRSTLSQADWKEDIQKAIITVKKGPHWLHIGHCEDDETYIFPEEALYLMEINALRLSFEGVPISIQQAYTLLLGRTISLPEYRVYSILSREGYKLIRHDAKRFYSDILEEDSDESHESADKADEILQNNNQENSKNTNESEKSSNIDDEMEKSIDDENKSIQTHKENNEILNSCEPNISSEEPNKNDTIEVINPETQDDCFGQGNVLSDDSCDDCMVVPVNPMCNTIETGKKRKNDESECKNMKSKRKKIMLKQGSDIIPDVIDIDDIPTYNKINILNSIVNCALKKIVHIQAPEKKFLPRHINLPKKNYFVNLIKVFGRQGTFNEQALPNRQSNTNNPSLNMSIQSSSYSCNRYSSTYNSSHIYGSHQTSNYFFNNTFFFNHIYQQVFIRHINSNNMLFKYNCFSQSSNIQFQNNNINYQQNQWSSNRNLPPPFSVNSNPYKMNVYNSYSQSAARPNLNISNNTNQNPNPYSAMFIKHRNMKRKNRRYNSKQGRHSNKELQSAETASTHSDSEADTLPDSTSDSSLLPQDKYAKLLIKIKHLLPKNNIFKDQQHLKRSHKALVAIVEEYNSIFNQNYMINSQYQPLIKSNREISPSSAESPSREPMKNEVIVHLSSDSDSSITCDITSNTSINNLSTVSAEIKNAKYSTKKNGKSKPMEMDSFSSDESNIENQSSNCIDRQSSNKNIESLEPIASTSKHCENISQDSPRQINSDSNVTLDIFHNWYTKDGWDKPEIPCRKIKRNSNSLKLTSAFLNSIKKFSCDNESNIQSWVQAKKFYDRKNMLDAVSISDDEDRAVNPEPGSSSINNHTTIEIDKIKPLVRPQDCKSVTTVLERLKVNKTYCADENISDDEKLKISYDIYMPNFKILKKSNPPSPAYSLIIKSHNSTVPKPDALAEIRKNMPSNVQILVAVVSQDTIIFIEMENVQLPDLIKKTEY